MNPITNNTILDLRNINLADKQLLVELGKNYYAIVILDTDDHIIFYQCKNQSIVDNDDFTFSEIDFKKVSISLISTNYLLVPHAFFDESNIEDYLKYLSTQPINPEYFHSESLLDYKILSCLDKDVISFKDKLFPNSKFCTAINSFLNYLNQIHLNDNENTVYINFYPNCFDLAIFKGNNLVSCVNEEFYNTDELLYFIILNLKTHQITTDAVEIIISGFIDEKNLNFITLKNNFTKVSFQSSEKLKSIYHFNTLEESYPYITTLNTLKCV